MKVYRIRARCVEQPAAADWCEQLVNRLGSRPRRLGRWSELGLYGALKCLASDSQNTLTDHAALVLSSQHGPALAMRAAVLQAREDLPLPMTFLQTQPSHLLAALSAQLGWRGDARFIVHAEPLAVLALGLSIADRHSDGLLLGWVNEVEAESSLWLRMQSVADPGGGWCPAGAFGTLLQHASHLRLAPTGLEVIIRRKYTETDTSQ